ncbi:MAG: DUF4920 domain-containing protein [Acidobacteria bacterium]|nr:DUF4920 domain-containing protein [Acidobacteriota bacterium]MBV9476392.1 DUF4920 domain-containing protein [Acidobacteriota bacterium]
MKQLAIALSLLVAGTLAGGEVVTRGAAIAKDAPVVALAQILDKPEAYTKDAVVTEGVITATCQEMGCWMQLAPANDKTGVRVTFKDYGFFVPTASNGYHARLAGVTTVKTLTKEEADHLEGEGAKLTRNADGTAREVSFVANGVELTK